MAIRFRCRQCQSLMSIASRRAGSIVACATCGEDVLVPDQDELTPSMSSAPPNAEVEFTGFTVANEEFVSPDPSAAVLPDEAHESDDSAARSIEFAREDEAASDHEDDSGFQLQREKPVEEELDLTAMVDVVFQLLIFFMVTASFSLTKSIQMPTPDQNKQGAAQAMQPLDDMQDTSVIVEIDDRDAIVVDDEPLGDVGRLPDALRDRMRKEQKSELVLTAAANATHRTVVAVIDAANEVGMQRIRMTAPSRSSSD